MHFPLIHVFIKALCITALASAAWAIALNAEAKSVPTITKYKNPITAVIST